MRLTGLIWQIQFSGISDWKSPAVVSPIIFFFQVTICLCKWEKNPRGKICNVDLCVMNFLWQSVFFVCHLASILCIVNMMRRTQRASELLCFIVVNELDWMVKSVQHTNHTAHRHMRWDEEKRIAYAQKVVQFPSKLVSCASTLSQHAIEEMDNCLHELMSSRKCSAVVDSC